MLDDSSNNNRITRQLSEKYKNICSQLIHEYQQNINSSIDKYEGYIPINYQDIDISKYTSSLNCCNFNYTLLQDFYNSFMNKLINKTHIGNDETFRLKKNKYND